MKKLIDVLESEQMIAEEKLKKLKEERSNIALPYDIDCLYKVDEKIAKQKGKLKIIEVIKEKCL